MRDARKEIGKLCENIDQNFSEYVKKLQSYLKQPSVSAENIGMKECAKMTMSSMKKLGAEAKLVTYSNGFPIVYGLLRSKKSKKTLIHYNMYDTVPAGPLEKWVSPPFDAKITDFPPHGDSIIARGVVNTKGPFMAFVNAVKSILQVTGDVPINIIFVIEGEEEIGSVSLPSFTKEYARDLRQADGVYMHGAFSSIASPRIFLGFKGSMILDFKLRIRDENVHSGWKPILDSAAWRLIWALNSLYDSTDEIAVEGFCEDVQPISSEDLKLLESLMETLDEHELRRTLGGTRGFRKNMHGIELLKAYCFEPSINVSGIFSGHIGPDQNMIPAAAQAHADVRLVPNMVLDDVLKKIKNHLTKHGFADVKVTKQRGYAGCKTSMKVQVIQALINTYRRMGKDPEIWPMSGSTIPGYVWMNPPLNLPSFPVIGGLGNGGNAHAPNEYLTVEGYRQCIKSAATFIYEFATLDQT